MATQDQDIPIYVVQDKQTGKQYPKHLGMAMLDAVKTYQRDNPVQVPYAPGTPSMQMRQLDENRRQYDQQFSEDTRRYNQEWPLQEALTRAQIANTQRLAAGGGSGLPKLTEPERFSATLAGAIDNVTDLMEKGARMPGDPNLGMTPIRKFDAKAAFDETLKRLRQSNTGLSHTQLNALEKQLAQQFGIELDAGASGTNPKASPQAIINAWGE